MATETAAPTAARQLAEFVLNVRTEELSPEVIHKTKQVLVDGLGAGISGSTADEGRRAIEAITDFSPQGDTTIWGTDLRVPAPSAALANGVSMHSLEMDDFHGCDHSGAVVLPAALAIAETTGRGSGNELLAAIVAGYDLAKRPMEACGGYSPHNGRGWHSTGTCGSFGAAAAAARMLGLDIEQTTWAIGLAGTFTGGVWAFIEDGAMSKRLHPGKAAENGVTAAYLARRGFTGPTRIFEAQWGGFLKTYADGDYDLDALTAGLGDEYRIMETGFKPYASCRGVHSAIDSLLAMQHSNGVTSDNVEDIVVTISPFLYGMVGNAEIRTMLDAQMSLPYGLAVTLLTGDASIAQYTPERRQAPDVHDALSKIRMNVDQSIPAGQEPWVEVRLRDGRVFRNRVEIALGAAENPLSDDALSDKFRSLAGLAYPSQRVEELLDTLWNVEKLSSLAPLVRLLGPA